MTEDMSRQRSLMFLSLLCFALADVRDGLGPFLGVYFQQQGWAPDEIGFVMTAGGWRNFSVIRLSAHWPTIRASSGGSSL